VGLGRFRRDLGEVTVRSARLCAPSWSRDGQRIYFSSDRGGGWEIWRTPAAGGPIERITNGGGGLVAYESTDGQAVLYQTAASDSS